MSAPEILLRFPLMKRTYRSRCQAALAVLTFFILPLAHADDFNLLKASVVQQAILSQHANWEARDNWVSQLPQEQVKRMLGLQTPPDTNAEFAIALAPPKPGNPAAPATLDWRNKDGVNWVSPMLNQGNCGSCVAFATVGTLETQINVTSGIPGFNPSFSTQALFACGGGACDFGWQPELASRFLQTTGVPDEACAPYTMGATGDTVSCSSICSDSAARSTKIVSYSTPSMGVKDINAVKAALAHGPLQTTLMVYADFLTYHKGVYKHVTGTLLGGHAISIVGYDDTTRSWIIRNSWGTDWGNGGFANISYDDISGVSNETWSYNVASPKGYVSVTNPHGRMFLAGTVDLQATSTFAHTTNVQMTIENEVGKPMKVLSCSESPCQVAFDTKALPDGKYEIFAESVSDAGRTVSEHEQFFVMNSTPTVTLSYTMQDGVDLTKPLTDRIVFNLTSSTGTAVPLSAIRFHVAQNGQEVYTTHANIVLNQMTMGWRTNTVADGNYDIWFTGEISAGTNVAAFDSPRVHVTTKNGKH